MSDLVYKCPGCSTDFSKILNPPDGMSKHLGRNLYQKFKKGKLTAAMCIKQNSKCQKKVSVLKFLRLKKDKLKTKTGHKFVKKQQPLITKLSSTLERIPACEKGGISLATINDCVAKVAGMTAVRWYTDGMPPRTCGNVYRFLLFMLYSLYASSCLTLLSTPLSEFTLAIGVGDGGMQRIDDVQCFACMHFRLSFLPRMQRVLWIIIAHSLVRQSVHISLVRCAIWWLRVGMSQPWSTLRNV